MRSLSLILLAANAFAGQSILLGPQFVYNNSGRVPNSPTNRVEFYLHDWSTTAVAHVVSGAYGFSGATGWGVQTLVFGTTVQLYIHNNWETSAGTNDAFVISSLTNPALYIRCQHDPSTMTDTVEAWDIYGNEIYSNTSTYSAEVDTGTDLWAGAGGEPNFCLGWLRIHTTLVPRNSRPPVTYDPAGVLLWWKFDGNLSDSSGHGFNATYSSGGPPTYAAQPHQEPPVAVLKTGGAPLWANVASLRAGQLQSLDGTASYSQADTSASVNCFWQALAGPSTVQWQGQNTCSPNLEGLIFGDYQMQLTVTDASGGQNQATADVGAVAMDDNGVVVNANPLVDTLFGGMIAFGKNPWGYADRWHQQAMNVRLNIYQNVTMGPGSGTLVNPQWEQTGSGTVSYYWNGTGPVPANSAHGTTLNGAITATSTSLTLSNASVLDFSELPTRIILNVWASNSEEIRICSVSGNILTVCYDGRGQSATAWPTGTTVGQYKISGAGTHFISDVTAPVCPLGAPSPPGPALFTGGTVTMTPGSAVVTTTATNWAGTYGPTNGYFPASWGGFYPTLGAFIRVQATHGGAPFTFIAQLATGGAKVNDNAGAVVISNGTIVSVTPYYPGSGYTAGHVHVTIQDPTGSGAVVTPNVVNGAVTSYNVIAGGSNYSNPVFVVWADMVNLNRPYPADADLGTYSGYAIMNANRTIDLRSPHAVTFQGTGESLWQTSGCESETAVYSNAGVASDATGWFNRSFGSAHDVPSLDGLHFTGQLYSVTDTTFWVNTSGTGGIDFYGEGLASRALYYRSGLSSALQAANLLDGYMIKSPWGNRDVNGYSELFVGGLALGAFNCVIINGGTCGVADWNDLRAYALSGELMVNEYYNGNGSGNTINCNYNDSRDSGYAFSWLILSAIYDPDTAVYRPRWQNDLNRMLAVDNACKRSDNSWSNVGNWNPGGFGPNPMTMTHGSTAVTGTGISATNFDAPGNNCYGVTTGTGTVTTGSSSLTVTGGTLGICTAASCPSSIAVVVADPTGQYAVSATYQYTGSGTATLAFAWPYPYSGNVTWMSTNPGNGNLSLASGSSVAFGTDPNDYADLSHNYSCIWNSPSSLTLSHPWQGATGSSYYGYSGNISGYGQQPFMLGIKTYGMQQLASAGNVPGLSSLAAAYQSLVNDATGWITTSGVDTPTLTTNYARVFGFCEPSTIPTNSSFDVRSPGCNYGSSNTGEVIGREQNQELGNALATWYQNSPTPQNKAFVDQLYGAVWGNKSYNTGGVYWDANSDAMNVSQTNMQVGTNGDSGGVFGGKWYGFFAGVGNLSRWPAVRVGGVAPPDIRTVYVPFSLAGIPNASQAKVTITQPNGLWTPWVCASSPCAVTADARSGSVLMRVDYLNASGTVVAPGENLPFYLPR